MVIGLVPPFHPKLEVFGHVVSAHARAEAGGGTDASLHGDGGAERQRRGGRDGFAAHAKTPHYARWA